MSKTIHQTLKTNGIMNLKISKIRKSKKQQILLEGEIRKLGLLITVFACKTYKLSLIHI